MNLIKMKFSNETITELMKLKENRRCFDCNVKSCQWASINNGLFLCTNCSGIHRGLGVDKSYIRSILWDNWTENQLEFMKRGGNKSLKEFLNDYPYDKEHITPEIFYNSKIMDYYRKLLKSKVEKKELDLIPPLKDEAFDIVENININKINNFSSCGSEEQKNSEINNTNNNFYFSYIQNGFNSFKEFVGKNYEKTMNNLDIKNKINSAYNTAKNYLFDNKNKNFFGFILGGKNKNEVDNNNNGNGDNYDNKNEFEKNNNQNND